MNSNTNSNMRRDGRALTSINEYDFDIDYAVLPTTTINDKINATLHERALQAQEEGRVLQLHHLPKYQAAKKALERSRRAVVLAKVRFEHNNSSNNSNDNSKIKIVTKARIDRRQSLPLTAFELNLHLQLIRFDTRLRFVVEHRRKAKARKATLEAFACNLRMAARRRACTTLVSQEAAAVGRARLRKQQTEHQVLPLTSISTVITPLTSDDVRSKTTSQLLWILSDLRDSDVHHLYGLVQSELSERSEQARLVSFHDFLDSQESIAARAIAASEVAVTAHATRDTDRSEDRAS